MARIFSHCDRTFIDCRDVQFRLHRFIDVVVANFG